MDSGGKKTGQQSPHKSCGLLSAFRGSFRLADVYGALLPDYTMHLNATHVHCPRLKGQVLPLPLRPARYHSHP
jgi:hypothetical protein